MYGSNLVSILETYVYCKLNLICGTLISWFPAVPSDV